MPQKLIITKKKEGREGAKKRGDSRLKYWYEKRGVNRCEIGRTENMQEERSSPVGVQHACHKQSHWKERESFSYYDLIIYRSDKFVIMIMIMIMILNIHMHAVWRRKSLGP